VQCGGGFSVAQSLRKTWWGESLGLKKLRNRAEGLLCVISEINGDWV